MARLQKVRNDVERFIQLGALVLQYREAEASLALLEKLGLYFAIWRQQIGERETRPPLPHPARAAISPAAGGPS